MQSSCQRLLSCLASSTSNDAIHAVNTCACSVIVKSDCGRLEHVAAVVDQDVKSRLDRTAQELRELRREHSDLVDRYSTLEAKHTRLSEVRTRPNTDTFFSEMFGCDDGNNCAGK